MSEERWNLFGRMLDRRDVVDFVKEIEKYQCLYDQNSFQYANKALKRRAWHDVAKKYRSSVHDCKEKWRKIRIAYMRWVKLSKSGNPPSRPYYLADYLQFISPDKKVGDNVPTTNSPESPMSSEDDVKLEIDEYDHLADSDAHTDEHQQDIFNETNERNEAREGFTRAPDEYRRSNNLSSINTERLREDNSRLQIEIERDASSRRNVINRLETQKSIVSDENNPRRMFLLSLLPDIEMLNEQEMRTFRREVISLLDNIITTRDSVIISLSNNKK